MVWSFLTRRKASLGLLGIIYISSCATQTPTSTPELIAPAPETPSDITLQPTEAKKSYRLKEPFAIQDEETDVVIAFSEFRTHKGEEFLKPKEGHYWYILKGTVNNRSSNPFLISPDFYTLIDAKEDTYKPSFRAHALEGIRVLQGEIPAQTTKTAEIGFELPEGSQPVTLEFNISNFRACNDSLLKTLYFCKPILIKVSEGRG